ncbi:hypothetical protein B0H14DRAFT_2570549 [Mycena olivaceomarginata]|nr:hypothetical protein B0H14DRAFT_2570549 [Mycena olivaceomarginata]
MSVHGAGIEHGSGGKRIHGRWPLGAHRVGIEVPGEGRAARIEVRMVGNEHTWGGDQWILGGESSLADAKDKAQGGIGCAAWIPGKTSNSSLDAMSSSPKEACGGRYTIKRCRRRDGQIRGLQTNLRDYRHRGSRKDTEYASVKLRASY